MNFRTISNVDFTNAYCTNWSSVCQSSENATSKIDKLTNWNLSLSLSDIDTSISDFFVEAQKLRVCFALSETSLIEKW